MGDTGTVPEITDEHISFNGVGEDRCETCFITKAPQDFEFCKTRQLPYDSIVVGVLRMAHNCCSSMELSSDGDPGVFNGFNE
jgi:hypothetical protein